MRHRFALVMVLSCAVLLGSIPWSSAYAATVAEFGESGFFNIDYQLQLRGAWRDIGSGPTGEDSTKDIYFRRNRLSFLGMVNDSLGFAVQFEYNGDQRIGDLNVIREDSDFEFKTLDAYLTFRAAEAFQIRAGRTKHIVTREVLEGCFDPLSADRSIFINGPFRDKRTRDDGLVLWGNLFDEKFQYRLAAMRGNSSEGTAPDDAGYRYSGRAHITLWEPESGFGYKGTYLGKKKVLTFGAGYEVEADAVFATDSGAAAADYKAFSYDVFMEYPTESGAFTLSGAYYETDFDKAGLHGVLDASGVDGEKNGSYWKAGYLIGKVQVFGRIEDWAFASLNGVLGQEVDWQAAGVNFFIKGEDLRVTLEYSTTDFKIEDTVNKDFKTALAQLQVKF